MKVNHRYYILILVAICAFCISAFGYVILYQKIVKQARDSSQALAEVFHENELKQHEQELSALYASSLTDRSRLPGFIVSEEKIVEFIEGAEQIGRDTGTDLALSAIAAPDLSAKPKNAIAYTTAHVDVNGSWQGVMKALILIENMPYSISIRHLKLDTSSASDALSTKKSTTAHGWDLSFDLRALTTK